MPTTGGLLLLSHKLGLLTLFKFHTFPALELKCKRPAILHRDCLDRGIPQSFVKFGQNPIMGLDAVDERRQLFAPDATLLSGGLIGIELCIGSLISVCQFIIPCRITFLGDGRSGVFVHQLLNHTGHDLTFVLEGGIFLIQSRTVGQRTLILRRFLLSQRNFSQQDSCFASTAI